MFCDLVGSTALSAQLDPEEFRAVVQQYQQTCTAVIQRYEGYLAQYLGDGLLVYFGYPTAHEDDARRAVRAGLGDCRGSPQASGPRHRIPPSPHRHSHRVSGHRRDRRSETHGTTGLRRDAQHCRADPGLSRAQHGDHQCGDPTLDRRVNLKVSPLALTLSKASTRLSLSISVQSERQSGNHLEGKTALTPLVGREQEVGLLFDRWEQVKEGRGQVVLLSGEPGIGKSRLAYTLREHVTNEGSLLFEAHCSPYHQHSALYPLIEVLQRTLLLTRQDTDKEKVEKLERALTLYGLQESLPLFTFLLSLPTPPQYPPLNFTPQKQKERTLQALVQLLVAQAERQATVSVWEDLHWADPSSLEFFTLLIEQIPTTKLLLILTFRPEFTPPWKLRSHVTQLMLNRLGKTQVEAMIEKVVEGRSLSAEVIEQIRAKTDGVPLFVEELTKSVVETIGTGTGDRD